MAASFLAGLLKGFNTRSQQAREEARAEQDAQDAKEERYLNLIASSDDPEAKNAAIVALGQRAAGVKPPKGGWLASLMGPKVEPHPAVNAVLNLVNAISNGTAGPLPGTVPPEIPANGFTPSSPAPMAGTPPPRMTLAEAMSPTPPHLAAPPPDTPTGPGFGPNDTGGPLPQAPATPPPTPTPAGPPPGTAAMAPPPTPGSLNPAVAGTATPPPAPAATGPFGAAPAKSPNPPGGPAAFGTKPPLPGTTPTQPRKLFLSTTEKAMMAAKAPLQADIEMLRSLNTPEDQIQSTMRAKIGGRSAASARDSYVKGDLVRKSDGTWVQQWVNRFDPGDVIETEGTDPGMKSVAPVNTDAQLAHEMFGKFYPGMMPNQVLASLNAAQRTAMEAERTRRLQTHAFATGTGSGEAAINTELGKPIGVQNAQDSNLPATTTLRDLGNRPLARPLPQSEANRLAELQNAVTMAGELETTLGQEAASGKTTGVSARLGALLPNFVTEYTGWGADAKSRNAVIALAKQIIGKSFEGGVLRKEDEIKYADILPTIGDPPDVAASKMALLKRRVQQQLDTQQGQLGSAGFRVGPPPAVTPAGAPKVGQTVGQFLPGDPYDHAKYKVDQRPDPKTGQMIYIGYQPDGTPVELAFTGGKYVIK